MDNIFDTPEIPDPPAPQASLDGPDPNEIARRNKANRKLRIGRDALVVDQGGANKGTSGGNAGTGLRIGA